jgi:hypothetical protein
MTPSDETLMAYADGELDDTARQAVEAAVHDDPDVAMRVAQHRALRAAVSGAFSSVLDEPVPERLLSAARQAPAARSNNVVSLIHALGAKTAPRPPTWRPYVLAASLSVGIGIGYGLWHDSTPVVIADANGGWTARGALSRALSAQLASEHPTGSVATIGLSYRTKSGDYCRTFSLSRNASSGVACLEDDAWHIRVLAAQSAAPSVSPEYRTAGSTISPLIRSAVESDIQGDVLDQAGEIAARQAGWKHTQGR